MITFQMLQKIVQRKEKSDGSQRVIKQKNVEIYRRISLDGMAYTIVFFTKAKQAFMELYDAKKSLILFDKYLLFINGPTKESVNFNELRVFNIDKGTLEDKADVNFGICEKKDIMVVDKHLIVVKQKDYPRFAVIINDRLTEIPLSTAEEILRFPLLNIKQQDAMLRFYDKEKWENHNNILINPERYSVPGLLALVFISKRKPSLRMLKHSKKMDLKMLEVILSLNKTDRQTITYIQSDKMM